MLELSTAKKPVSVIFQLTFLLGWILLIAWISAIGDTGQNSAELEKTITPNLMRLMIIVQGIFVFLLPSVFCIYLLQKSTLAELKFRTTFHPLMVAGGCFAIVFSYPLVEWMGQLNAAIDLPESFSGWETWMKVKEKESATTAEILLKDKTALGLIGNLLTIAFTAAFCEEIFFRGMLQRTLSNTKMNIHTAIWISAIIFSAIHLQFYGFFPRMILGAVLGYLFYFTNNIWVSILAHFLNNALVVVSGFFTTEINLNPLEETEKTSLWGINFLLALLSISAVAWILNFLQKRFQQSLTDQIE